LASVPEKSILVGYDGSPGSDRALQAALALASRVGAGVVAVYAARLDLPPYDYPMMVVGDPLLELKRFGERVLNRATAHARTFSVPFSTEVLTGPPADTLARRAEQEDVVDVVVGRSGGGAVSRLLMGSVTNRLAHVCPKALLVVP
jgi:nucleotide-binding universal stress UspA family protein